MMSKETAVRPWPTCGASYGVGPQTYIDTAPGTRGTNATFSRAAVSYSLITRCARLGGSPRSPLQHCDGPYRDALGPADEADALAALGLHTHEHRLIVGGCEVGERPGDVARHRFDERGELRRLRGDDDIDVVDAPAGVA